MAAKGKKKTRQDNHRERREALIKAGLKVVARHGYRNASVQRITDSAGLAQGTLYSYFGSHQALLNELLPAEGQRFSRYIDRNAPATGEYFEDQRRRFLAVSRFLQRNRHFLRVMTDAECAAPDSYAHYISSVEDWYLKAQYAAEAVGQIRKCSDEEYRVIAEILAGSIGHIALGFGGRPSSDGPGIPDWAADTFVKFIRDGMTHGGSVAEFDVLPKQVVASNLRPRTGGTREHLLDAAAEVVMKRGFADANVTAIAEAAKLSVGALYTHFASQQELFDQLLDHVRVAMIDHVRAFTHGAGTLLEREFLGFCGFFDFLTTSPWYMRIESEASVWAPETYRRHFYDLADSYVMLLRRAQSAGELVNFDDRELPVLAYIFMAARHYTAARYVPADGSVRQLPDHVMEAYRRLLQRGMSAAN